MGYISTEQVKAVREEIKKVLRPQDGFKISVTREHYSTIRVALMVTPLELASYEHKGVNNYYLGRVECKTTRTIFELIEKAVNRAAGVSYNRNANDPGADYPDCNYYKHYEIGKWNKGCQFVNK